jgi:glycosyltransferase involved in cell wall biosynthesis
VEERPWEHPFLTEPNLRRFRDYSLGIHEIALAHARAKPTTLDVGFCVNLAQNMYKWARLAQKAGAAVTLYLHAWDDRALSSPAWEDYDGEWHDVLDGTGFRRAHPELSPVVPCVTPPLEACNEFQTAWQEFQGGARRHLFQCQNRSPDLRYDALFAYQGVYAYLLPWAEQLARHEVCCAAYFPAAAYLSGRPYCATAVGDDLQYDCGRADQLGRLMGLSFNGARFLWISNPHVLGHCRRLGFGNGVHLPYPMDDSRYCPGPPQARKQWQASHGPGFYVLSACRLDDKVKGNATTALGALAALARRLPALRFVFLTWGSDAAAFAERVRAAGLQDRFLILPPVGKARLIDYYRSCDCVLDQFVYGYYGATALEACAVGKPVIMRVRERQYAALCGGDVAPVLNCRDLGEAVRAIEALATNGDLCGRVGQQSREWLVRNHGEAVTTPLMLALLQFARDRQALPPDLRNPLWDEETDEESAYHRTRLRTAA